MSRSKRAISMSLINGTDNPNEDTLIVKFAATNKNGSDHAVSEQQKLNSSIEQTSIGRINLQLSCTIAPEDKELLNELALYACNRERKLLNTSIIVRALIRLGAKYKKELIFDDHA